MSFDIIDDTLEVSKIEGKHIRDEFRVISKLTEECGEAATIINKPHEKHPEGLNGEVADVIITAIDLLFVHVRDSLPNLSPDEHVAITKSLLTSAANKKIKKWKDKYFQ